MRKLVNKPSAESNYVARVIVHAITNYDIHTNEIFTVHQHQLNNNKHHGYGITADLLKVR